MTENVKVHLFVDPGKIDNALIVSVVDACIKVGSKYNETNGYSDTAYNKDLGVVTGSGLASGTLDKAITAVSKSGGQIFLDHRIIGDYSVAFRCGRYKDTSEFDRIVISVDRVRFRYERSGTKNGLDLINIAKSIWNDLYEKPIYGYGDYSLVLYINKSQSDDNEIFALNVPINKFWLNFYGKKMIEKFGRKKLEEGAYKVEELNDGLLVATDVVPKACKNAGSWEDEEHLEPSEEYLKEHKMKKK